MFTLMGRYKFELIVESHLHLCSIDVICHICIEQIEILLELLELPKIEFVRDAQKSKIVKELKRTSSTEKRGYFFFKAA
jgi:hypothetical protein